MAVFEIPIDSADGAYTLDVELAGQVYRLGLACNGRGDYWALDLGLPDGMALITGQALRLGVDVLGLSADPRLPTGRLVLVDTSVAQAECGADDLGTRCLLLYDDGEG